MPYELEHVKNGWYVISTNTGKRHSIKPFKTKREAEQQRKALYVNANPSVEGSGFLLNLFGGARKSLSRSDKAFYDSVKNVPMFSIMVVRVPIASVFNKILNLASFGKWNANLNNQPYDKVFHLYVLMTYLDNGNIKFALSERNETVRFRSASSKDFTSDKNNVMQIPYTANSLTLGQVFDNTIRAGGDNIWVYDFNTNNCQDYIVKLLQANNLANPNVLNFVKQDTTELVQKSLNPVLRAGLTGITDIASIGRKITGLGLFNENIDLGY